MNLGDKMNIEKEMFEEAIKLLRERYEEKSGGVAILRLESGKYLTSTWIETNNSMADLCADCVCRQEDNESYQILSPCGICQERLFFGEMK